MSEHVQTNTPLGDLLDRVDGLSRDKVVTFGALLKSFGRAAFVPLMLLPALAVVTPLSGIPLFSSLCGLTIALIASQMLVGRDHLWLPEFLLRRKLHAHRVRRAVRGIRPVASWIDTHSRQRFRVLTSRPFQIIGCTICMVAGLMMPFLEFVPFSSSILGAAIVLIATSFLVRDGIYMLVALLTIAAAVSLPVALIS